MKFLADECCAAPLVEFLRSDGHDVLYVLESMRGAIDGDILARAFVDERILITEDKDFGELVYRQQQNAFGVVLLRFEAHEDLQKAIRLRELIRHRSERLVGAFVVLEPDKIRIRPLRS